MTPPVTKERVAELVEELVGVGPFLEAHHCSAELVTEAAQLLSQLMEEKEAAPPKDVASAIDDLTKLKPFLEAHHCSTEAIDEAARVMARMVEENLRLRSALMPFLKQDEAISSARAMRGSLTDTQILRREARQAERKSKATPPSKDGG